MPLEVGADKVLVFVHYLPLRKSASRPRRGYVPGREAIYKMFEGG